MSEAPVVSWAGPVERASQALDRATELFERKQFGPGLEEMGKVQVNLILAVEFIMKNHMKKPEAR